MYCVVDKISCGDLQTKITTEMDPKVFTAVGFCLAENMLVQHGFPFSDTDVTLSHPIHGKIQNQTFEPSGKSQNCFSDLSTSFPFQV